MALPYLAFAGGFLARLKVLDNILKRFNEQVAIGIPDTASIVNAWLKGTLDDSWVRKAYRQEGIDPENLSVLDLRYTSKIQGKIVDRLGYKFTDNNGLNGVSVANCSHPGLPDLFALWNRGLITEEVANSIFSLNGFRDPNIVSALKDLRFEIPPIQDLIRFSVRESFDLPTIEKYGYANEIPNEVRKYAAMQGLTGELGLMKPKSVGADGKVDPERKATWTDLYWFAHWELPSPTQAYDMLHKLYPNSRYGPSPTLKPNTAFTSKDLADLLKASDYPTYWRERLEAISYLPLTRVDVRRMYDIGVKDRAGIYHAYRAIGYDDNNAEDLTRFTVKLKEDREKATNTKGAKKRVCESYQLGMISRREMREALADVGYDESEVLMISTECDYDMRVLRVKRMLRVIKTQYIKGVVDKDTTIRQLHALGIRGDRSGAYIDEWSMELSIGRREPTAQEIVKWYKEGMIDPAVAFERLTHLGYDRSTATMMIGYAANEVSAKRSKAYKASLKEAENAAKKKMEEAKSAVREQKQDAKSKLKMAVQGASEKNLKTWLEQGDMTRGQVKGFLILKGWAVELADKWINTVEKNVKEDK